MRKNYVIVPFRDIKDHYRTRNLERVLEKWLEFDDFDVILSCDGPRPDIYIDPRVELVEHPREDELFRKTRILNRGVKAASPSEEDLVILGDADVICLGTDFARNFREFDGEGILYPFAQTSSLSLFETNRLFRDGLAASEIRRSPYCARYTGYCNAVTYKTFLSVGGYDDAFYGWGSEDDAFLYKIMRKYGHDARKRKDGLAMHLWHPSGGNKYYEPDTIKNRRRMLWMIGLSDENFEKYLRGELYCGIASDDVPMIRQFGFGLHKGNQMAADLSVYYKMKDIEDTEEAFIEALVWHDGEIVRELYASDELTPWRNTKIVERTSVR